MSNKCDEMIADLEFWIRQKVSNRPEIGLFAFRFDDSAFTHSSDTFSYPDCVAIAALLTAGYLAGEAAAMVSNDIVYASPHVAGRAVEAPDGRDPVGQRLLGIYRLADGALWAVHADNDIESFDPYGLSSSYAVFATRGWSITAEEPQDRARHLLTEVNDLGDLVSAA